jgi:4-hydroxy-2-oxoheptanedioate aldolase
MKTNEVKRKLERGEPSFGTWLSLGNLHAARVLARLGFDWLTVDLEHAPIDWSQAAALFAAIADSGCVPLARVPCGHHDHIKRVLDAGAWGIVAPMIETVEQARVVVAAAKYPPEGNRSVGGGMHALNFAATAGQYYEHANQEILVVLQTESPQGVENASAIYRVPGVDAIFVGPNDLKAQMRSSDGAEPTMEQFESMLQRVIDVGRETHTPTGMHVFDPHSAVRRAQQGMQFIAIGSDLQMMVDKAQACVSILRPENKRQDVARY